MSLYFLLLMFDYVMDVCVCIKFNVLFMTFRNFWENIDFRMHNYTDMAAYELAAMLHFIYASGAPSY